MGRRLVLSAACGIVVACGEVSEPVVDPPAPPSFTLSGVVRDDDGAPVAGANARIVDGPFRDLDGSWRFSPLGEDACKIEFRLRYEFSSKLLERLVGPVFHYIANSLVEVFVKRARQLHGPR